MENVVVNGNLAAVMAQNRKVAQKYGQFFGKMLFSIQVTNPDLKWKEDCLAGRQTLRNEVKAFIIKGIDISGVAVLEKDLDGYPKIILNKGTKDEIIFPMAEPDFTKATRENVAEAIERACKPNSKPMFFSSEDLPTLTELVRMSNQSALDTYEKQAQKMVKLAETVRGMMDAADRMQAEYMRQCGIDTTDVVEVNVSVEVEK